MDNWPNYLAYAVHMYNSTPSIFNTTPYYLAIGRTSVLNEFAKKMLEQYTTETIQRPMREEDGADEHDAFTMRLYELDMMKKDRDVHNDLKRRRRQIVNLLKKPFGIPAGYSKGDWVFKKKRKSKKTDPEYDGPYQIMKVIEKGAYQLRNINGRIEKGTYNQDMLKPSFTYEDSPIHAATLLKNGLREAERKLVNKMVDEINNQTQGEKGDAVVS
ncbi:uncharacterized protein J8A68_006116 [[Candida] subhashii]|uniref:Uncharacterized protein n=1 Tax=[Candida] subhashii TaxID=561895 RepID=A0A8J5Q079_9ASCO|nr:uncharacterized protein J8A68_006116 [[Candida] subhashii]KAG7660374.1 hypothetical protein J8A68_006116 [[Candida] subhashii]